MKFEKTKSEKSVRVGVGVCRCLCLFFLYLFLLQFEQNVPQFVWNLDLIDFCQKIGFSIFNVWRPCPQESAGGSRGGAISDAHFLGGAAFALPSIAAAFAFFPFLGGAALVPHAMLVVLLSPPLPLGGAAVPLSLE